MSAVKKRSKNQRKEQNPQAFRIGLLEITSKTEAICLLIILAISVFMRLEPFLSTPDLPYGAEDSSFHYQMSRMISEGADMSKCYNCLDYNVYKGIYGYPPLTHYLSGLISRFTSIKLQYIIFPLNAIFSTALVLFVYLLSRRLFGPYPALASAAFMMASYRDIWALYYGEWPNIYGMVFIPLSLIILLELKKKPSLLPVFAASLGFAVMTYPQTALYIVLVSAAYMTLVERPRIQLKGVLLSIIILILLAVPVVVNLEGISRQLKWEENNTLFNLGNLFQLYSPYIGGVPQSFKNVFEVYTVAVIPLVAAGLYYLLKNFKDPKARLLLIMLFCQYLLTHSDTLGFGTGERAVRAVNSEALIVALVVGYVFSQTMRKRIWVILLISLAAVVGHNLYTLSFPTHWLLPMGFGRPTYNELSAFMWVKANTSENATFIRVGGSFYNTGEWATALTQRRFLTVIDGNYLFERTPVQIDEGKDMYFILDNNLVFVKPEDRNVRLLWVNKKNEYLKNFTIVVFSNDEVIIRRLEPSTIPKGFITDFANRYNLVA